MRNGMITGAALLLSTFATACDGTIAFSTTQRARTQVDPCDGVLQSMGFSDLDSASFRQTTEVQGNDIQPSDIRSLRVTDLVLRVISPPSGDLSYLDRITFFIESPGLARQMIAELNGVPAGQREVRLDTSDAELQPYVTADTFRISTDTTANDCPEQTQIVEAAVTFEVEATGKGIVNLIERIPIRPILR